MTKNSYLKLEIRTRMERTGESYSAASRAVAKGEDTSRTAVQQREDFEFPQLPFDPTARERRSSVVQGDELNQDESDPNYFVTVGRRRREKEAQLKALILFTERAAALMLTGLTLIKAFEILAQHTEDPVLRDVLLSVPGELERGLRLGQILASHPEAFPGIFPSLIGADVDVYRGLKAMADVYRTELELL